MAKWDCRCGLEPTQIRTRHVFWQMELNKVSFSSYSHVNDRSQICGACKGYITYGNSDDGWVCHFSPELHQTQKAYRLLNWQQNFLGPYGA
ncbi:hypothetical protein MTR_4g113625 [Medicago truncatula]|uniref:Uncharacterized protein n=1 Tax=Medicago truncatula TaxID=3880 RepID=A0A072V1W1_MEDTR|nr:hypothetical protein MTR_4g113625 [Medicago truncatula]